MNEQQEVKGQEIAGEPVQPAAEAKPSISPAGILKAGCGLVLLVFGIVTISGAVFGGPSLERTADRLAEQEWRRGESEGASWVQMMKSPNASFPMKRDLASMRASMLLIEPDAKESPKYDAKDRDDLHLLVTKRLLEIAEQGGL